jgi:hypothetical protein
MANTTFNGPVRSEGGFEQITKNSTTGAVTNNFDVDTSGNVSGSGTMKMTGAMNYVKDVESLTAATKTVTSADSGTVYLINRAAGVVVTLPTAAAGLYYKFIIGTTITSNAFAINGATANDIYAASSNILLWDKDAPATVSAKQFYADGSDDDVMSMNGGTTGGFIGTELHLYGIATGGQGSATAVWHLSGVSYADGTLATPFA